MGQRTEEERELQTDWEERIEINPAVLVGKPVIRGTRIAVEFIIELLAEGWSQEEILRNYPRLTREDILTAMRWAGRAATTS